MPPSTSAPSSSPATWRTVRNEVRRFGGRIAVDAVSAVVEAIGNDLRQPSAAAGQPVSDFGGTIDADAVARFYRGQAEVTGFDVAERVLMRRPRALDRTAPVALQRGVAHVLIADALADSVRGTAARVSSLEHVRTWGSWPASSSCRSGR